MQKFCVSKNSRNRPEHHVIQWLSALQKNKMLRYSPWEIMGKKLNTIMWVQSSWTGTLVWHFAMSPSVTASPGEENSLPKRGTHLKVRQEMCFYAAEFLAATKLTATSKREIFQISKNMLEKCWQIHELSLTSKFRLKLPNQCPI